jgi:hypothetical protein
MKPAKAMGHMNQKWQNIHSTNKKVKLESEDESKTSSGKGEKPICFFALVLDQGQIYTDLTGNFQRDLARETMC